LIRRETLIKREGWRLIWREGDFAKEGGRETLIRRDTLIRREGWRL